MATNPTSACQTSRVLLRSDAPQPTAAPHAAAQADAFIEQGRTVHFTTFYSSGLLIHAPGDIILLTSDPGWRTSWSIVAPGNFSGRPFSDLLFYDPAAGVGEFYTTEGGRLGLMASNSGWRSSWSMIIPCNLSGGPRDDLLFYDPTAGVGEMYSTDGHGGVSLIQTQQGWRTSWSIILAANLTDSPYDDLLFYDPAAGVGEIYSTDGHGNIALVRTTAGWRSSWSQIAGCNLTGGAYDDLLFYDPTAGVGEMYSTDGHGGISLIQTQQGWRTSWSIVRPCRISGGAHDDLMFYDPSAGVGEFYSTDGHGNIALLQSNTGWRRSWNSIAPADFTNGAGQDLVFYDRTGGTGEIYTTRGNTLATAVLATCEADYHALQGYFGGLRPDDLPFKIEVQPGSNGASHGSCGDTEIKCDASTGDDPDLVRMLVVAEADEVFMDNQSSGWDCGASAGEGLSRVLSTHLYPREQSEFVTGPIWLKSDRHDWVSESEGTDQNFVSIGAATLFIHYLKFQLGYSYQQITQAGGSTVQRTYQGLTGRSDAFGPFKALLDRRFAAKTSTPLSTDNPFPIDRDLLFYDQGAGTGEFYSSDIDGATSLLASDTGWRSSWTVIAPGRFSGGPFDDLLFYDPGAGTGEFYSTDGHGGIALLASNTSWRSSWDIIVPGRFGPSRLNRNQLDGILFYDRAAGTGEIYSSDGHGHISLLASHTDWRTSWALILVGCFTRSEFPDVLFYDAAAGLVEIYTTDLSGNLSLVKATPNLPHDWKLGLTCNITGGEFKDLMFYRPATGEVQFFRTDGSGSLTSLSIQTAGSNWTQIHATAFAELLFYDAAAGVGEYRRTTSTGQMTQLSRHTDWRRSWSIIAPGIYS